MEVKPDDDQVAIWGWSIWIVRLETSIKVLWGKVDFAPALYKLRTEKRSPTKTYFLKGERKMKELRKLEVGCSTKFAVLDENGGERVFKLAIISVRGCNGEQEYGMCFIHDDGFGNILKANGTYSGGITGCGLSSYDSGQLNENEVIVTTDLAVIKKMCEDASEKEALEKKAKIERMEAAVEELNALPEVFFEIETSGGVQYRIIRSNFQYNPSKSSRLIGGYSVERNFKPMWSLSDYFRKDGVMLEKKIAKDTDYLTGVKNLKEAVEIVKLLSDKMKEASKNVIYMENKAIYGRNLK